MSGRVVDEAVLAREILRMLDQADEHHKRRERAQTDWDRGLEGGKMLAFRAAAIRLGELTGLATQGMSEDPEHQVVAFRERVQAAVPA